MGHEGRRRGNLVMNRVRLLRKERMRGSVNAVGVVVDRHRGVSD